MKRVAVIGVLAVIAACQESPTATRQLTPQPAAPVMQSVPASSPIADEYIVRFNDNVADTRGLARALVAAHGGLLRHTYTAAIKGFAAHLPAAAVALLRAHPSVLTIEQDQEMHAVGTETPVPSWGLDRIDQHALPLDNSFAYGASGQGVTAYIIDTGILFAHSEFGGRAATGVDEITAGGNAQDCNGHGTHVSGTVGGATYGVAKSVALVAVRVLDCGGSGSTSGVMAGVDWVTNDHIARGTPAVANMSLGGGKSATLDQAVANSIASGVTYAIAAGNGNFLGIAQDACTTSPADVSTAITVSATDNTDRKASWANYGSCVKIFAPGVNITSSWYSSPTATNTISGTSMATPHVTGAAALYLETNPTATPGQVLQSLTSNGTAAVVTSPGTNSPNVLLYTSYIGGVAPPPPPPSAPVASFTYSCSSRTCSFDGRGSQNAVSYAWSFGDGASASGATTSHNFARNRNYTVTLTVRNSAGESNATSKPISCTRTCR